MIIIRIKTVQITKKNYMINSPCRRRTSCSIWPYRRFRISPATSRAVVSVFPCGRIRNHGRYRPPSNPAAVSLSWDRDRVATGCPAGAAWRRLLVAVTRAVSVAVVWGIFWCCCSKAYLLCHFVVEMVSKNKEKWFMLLLELRGW